MKTCKLILTIAGILFAVSCLENCSSLSENVINSSVNKSNFSSEEPLVVNGSMIVVELNVKDLEVNGSAKFGPKKCLVDGVLSVTGRLHATSLTVTGKTTAGSVNLDACSLKKSLEISGEASIANTTIYGDIVVKKSIRLVLGDNVTVTGTIIFENEGGIVSIQGKGIHLLGGINKNGKVEASNSNAGNTPLHFP